MLEFFDQFECEISVIIGLVLFHLAITATTLLTRKSCNIQAVLFLCYLILVYFSQDIIRKSFVSWKIFYKKTAEENQILFSVLYSVPILFNCMVIIGNWLLQSAQLTVTIKRAQLKRTLQKNK